MSEELGCAQRENGHCPDPSIPGLEEEISCACGRVMYWIASNTEIGKVGGIRSSHIIRM